MSTRDFLLSSWSWRPAMVPAAVLLLGATWAAWRAHHKAAAPQPWRWGYWMAGLALFFLAQVSPLGTLAEGYLFSAHMLQHLVLLLLVPGLCLLGWPTAHQTPRPQLRAAGRGTRAAGAASALLTHPAVAWLAGVGAMWLWHAPRLCDAATSSQTVRAVQFVSLLGLGTLFWWPIIGPQPQRRLEPLAGVLYLFSACVGCTLLGIFITFTPLTVCSVFTHPADPLGALPLIRQGWGMSPAVDQEVGGLIMWVPACLIYLGAIMTLLLRWFAGYEPRSQPVQSPA